MTRRSYIATRIKLTQAINEDCHDIIFDRLVDFCRDNGFLCRDKAGEVHKEECRDNPNSCCGTDQAHGNETHVATSHNSVAT